MLARDRLGIKPLYYAATPERVLFASELKAFRAVPDWKPTIDDDAVAGYLRHAYIAQPRTIYREASKLAARSHSDAAPGQDAGAEMLLGPARHRGRRPGAQRSGSGRERGGRAARCAAARLRSSCG